jgi:hypothetical protein
MGSSSLLPLILLCLLTSPVQTQLTLTGPYWGRQSRHPQSGVPSHRVRADSLSRVQNRLFIALMTAAHISPNVFSLRNFLSNIHVPFLAYIHYHSYLLYITFKQTFTSFDYETKSFYHFFGSSWQADCSQSLVSYTIGMQRRG